MTPTASTKRWFFRLGLLLIAFVLMGQSCRGPGVACRTENRNPSLVSGADTFLSGSSATQGPGGECVGAPGQDYTIDHTIYTASGSIYDPNAIVTVSMVNGCVGFRCTTFVYGFYSNNRLQAAVTGNYPSRGNFWGMAQVTFDGQYIPQDLSGWYVNIY